MTAKIKNITELRNFALETIEMLRDGKIDVAKAAISAKACDSVLATIKTEIDYAKATKTVPHIPFLDNTDFQNFIDEEPKKKSLTWDMK